MPAEREFSRKIAVVVGGGSGIGREVALLLAQRGAHVVVADQNSANAESTWADARKLSSPEMGMAAALDLSSRDSIAAALRATILAFGGVDIVINTAAIIRRPIRPPRCGGGLRTANQRHRQLRAGRRSGARAEGPEPARRDGLHELRECDRSKSGSEAT
jgi:NAD(P)-dependent dehydrogenase (short-subunit alcohol dehydrogenase family)